MQFGSWVKKDVLFLFLTSFCVDSYCVCHAKSRVFYSSRHTVNSDITGVQEDGYGDSGAILIIAETFQQELHSEIIMLKT